MDEVTRIDLLTAVSRKSIEKNNNDAWVDAWLSSTPLPIGTIDISIYSGGYIEFQKKVATSYWKRLIGPSIDYLCSNDWTYINIKIANE